MEGAEEGPLYEERGWPHYDHQEDWWCHGKVKTKDAEIQEPELNTPRKPRVFRIRTERRTETNADIVPTRDIQTDNIQSFPGAEEARAPCPPQHPLRESRDPEHGPEPKQQQYLTEEELRDLSDDDILYHLPKSKRNQHHAKRMDKCKYASLPACTAVATDDCQEYCIRHFCDLVRTGLLKFQIPRDSARLRQNTREKLNFSNETSKRQQKYPDYGKQIPENTQWPVAAVPKTSKKEKVDQFAPEYHTDRYYHRERDQFQKRMSSGAHSKTPECMEPTKEQRCKSSSSYHGAQKQTKRNPDIILSGEFENEIGNSILGPNQSQLSAKCIYGTCFNTAERNKLCSKCENILYKAKSEKVVPPQPSNSIGLKHNEFPRAFRPTNEDANQAITNRETIHCGDRKTHEKSTISRKTTSRRDRAIQDRCMGDSQKNSYLQHAPLQFPREQPGLNYQTHDEYSPSDSEFPDSLLSEATSISAENHGTDYLFHIDDSIGSLKRCKSRKCQNWGNSKCHGFCNECNGRGLTK